MPRLKRNRNTPSKRVSHENSSSEENDSNRINRTKHKSSNNNGSSAEDSCSHYDQTTGDDNISSGRRQKDKRHTKNSENVMKLNAKSKSISKLKMSENEENMSFCLKNLLQCQPAAPIDVVKGFELHHASSMTFIAKHGIEYADFHRSGSGIIKIQPGGKKKAKESIVKLRFLILSGKITLEFENITEEYEMGTTISIPKETKYGLSNYGDTICFMHYSTSRE